jgi:Flp pilus assembly protein TadG
MIGGLLRFFGTERGTAGVLYALSAIPLFALAGGVVDYAYMQDVRERLQNAADSAVLAAMRLDSPTDGEIRDTIVNYLRSNYRYMPRMEVCTEAIEVEVERSHSHPTRIAVRIPSQFRTTFWGLLGISTVSLEVFSEARRDVGGLEVVMVLDTTGSMQGSKIEELREAAKDMVDILSGLADNPQFVTLKVGMVPYTSYVNVGTDKAGEFWLDLSDCCGGYAWQGWVGTRREDLDISDDDFETHPVPAVPNYVNDLWHGDSWQYQFNVLKEIVPLRDLREPGVAEALKKDIDEIRAQGWTYIPGGLVWGWRVLSPQAPYTGGMEYDRARDLNVKKVIILMTDGVNTCRTTNERTNGLRAIKECGVARYEADARLRALCTRVKEQGVLITSVAYDITDQKIRELMEECSNFGYYTPMSGELREVFQTIARRLTRLHLSR